MAGKAAAERLVYAVAREQLRTSARFVDLGFDRGAAQEFLGACGRGGAHTAGVAQTACHFLLRTCLSHFDANGVLGMYPMHLATAAQLRALSAGAEGAPRTWGSVLDVGSGDGGVTRHLAPLTRQLVATELSGAMAKRLEARGWPCWNGDLAEPDSAASLARYLSQKGIGDRAGGADQLRFDMVSMLNVLDRSPRPRSLLQAAHRLLHPEDGWILLSTPLPFRPLYYRGASQAAPMESLLHGARPDATWHTEAEALMALLPSLGFQPLSFGRLPYISAGDALRPDPGSYDALLLLARRIPF